MDHRNTKRPGGLRDSSRNRSTERGSKEARLLTPSYINEEQAHSIGEIEPETKDKLSNVEPQPKREGYNELNPLMTRMVEDELNNIMIYIWQRLPDDAPNDVDKVVLEKLKGVAGDELRNTIGLNVTKRLLNVNNGILVKFVLSSRGVSSQEVHQFAKMHDIQEFRHVTVRTYAGRVASWEDLDQLYAIKDLKCGKARVKITPIYNFLKCPTNLRTVFDGNQNFSKSKYMEKGTARKVNKSKGKAIITADKVLAKEAMKTIAKKGNNSKNSNISAKVPNSKGNVSDAKNSKDNVPVKNSKGTAPAKKVKAEPASKNTTQIAKTVVATKNTTDKPVINNKTIVAKQTEQTKPAPKPAQIKREAKTTKIEPVKTVANKPPVTTNTTKKVTTTATVATKISKAETNVPNAGSNIPKDDVKAAKVESPKEVTKPTNKVLTTNKKEVKPNPIVLVPAPKITKVVPKSMEETPKSCKGRRNESDFDELDDHDILALLSSGIVLDECSGSDED